MTQGDSKDHENNSRNSGAAMLGLLQPSLKKSQDSCAGLGAGLSKSFDKYASK